MFFLIFEGTNQSNLINFIFCTFHLLNLSIKTKKNSNNNFKGVACNNIKRVEVVGPNPRMGRGGTLKETEQATVRYHSIYHIQLPIRSNIMGN